MNFSAAIFDLDGTLLDTLPDITASLNFGLKKYGFPTHSQEETRGFIGHGRERMLSRALPEGTDEETKARVLAAYTDYYALNSRRLTRPYVGIRALISELGAMGLGLGVVSNKHASAVRPILDFFFPDTFAVVSGQGPGIPIKPSPVGLLGAIEKLGAEKSAVIYVGDSPVDAETAHNAGVKCAAVTWGYRPEERLKDADYIAHSAAELRKIILG